jgi:arsenite methyltransferase
MDMSPPSPDHASSQGHALAGTGWLDVHFEAARPEYESLLRSVGLRRGWHVLDAGCGAGSFLPLIAADIGPTGRITALDLAPENIAVVEQRVAGWALDCPLSTRVGSVLELPLADGSVDAAIWNVAPGGPGPMWRALEGTRSINRQVHGMLRTPELRRWLEAAGYDEVWQQTLICERWAPLRASERKFHGDVLRWLGQLAADAELSEDDRAFWRGMQDPDAPEHPINQPGFSVFDGQTVVVGRVPGSTV